MATGRADISIMAPNAANPFSLRRALYAALAHEHECGGRTVRGLGRAIAISFVFWFVLAALVAGLGTLTGN
jgi:hypothetical protein